MALVYWQLTVVLHQWTICYVLLYRHWYYSYQWCIQMYTTCTAAGHLQLYCLLLSWLACSSKQYS